MASFTSMQLVMVAVLRFTAANIIRRLFSVLSLVSCPALKSDNNIDYDDGWPGRRRLISRGLDVTTRAGLVRNVTTHSTD